MPLRRLFLTVLAGTLPLLTHADPGSPVATACLQPGQWLIPAGPPVPVPELLDRLARKPVVLLGESHDRADDHRWQLAMLDALHRRRPDLAIGFEMFPRRVQPVLDDWVAGRLDEDEFLKQSQWDRIWGFDVQMYLPLFRFARSHRLPMLALNVERDLIGQVRAAGFDGVPEAQREGVGRPAAPSLPYRVELQAIYDSHPDMNGDGQDAAGRFERFVEAQTLWDRAMAEVIARYRQGHPDTLVVGILGAGHLRHGHGVPHQLDALGQGDSASLMTWPSDRDCAEINPTLADVIFVIPPQPMPEPPPPPRLGVTLGAAATGVAIEKVWPDSLAERSGLKDGDVIVRAAGRAPAGIESVRETIRRQPAGTWLPLMVRRDGAEMEIVVRFPAQAEP